MKNWPFGNRRSRVVVIKTSAKPAEVAAGKKPDEITGQNSPARYRLLLAFLTFPVILYLASFFARRDEEMLRYHREMLSFEEGALASLDAGSQVIFAAAQPEPTVQAGETDAAGKEESSCGPASTTVESYATAKIPNSFVELSQSFYVGLGRKAYRPCAVNWTGGAEDLTLHFSVDRPATQKPAKSAPPPQVVQAPQSDHRLRIRGKVHLHQRLAELARLTGFDALLIADQRGELILRLGPSADLFSTLPILASGWEGAIESELDKKDPHRVFVPNSIQQVERQVAGRKYTLFPREIVLSPTQLVGAPLYCRGGDQGQTGQETLRLRAVGLVLSSQLNVKALRPVETWYWYWCLTYATVLFFALHLYRGRWRQAAGVWPRLIAAVGFGLLAGMSVALVFFCCGLWGWEDGRLKELAERFRATANEQLEKSEAALKPPGAQQSPFVERFSCMEGPVDGPLRMVRLQTGQRADLRPVWVPNDYLFLKEKAENGLWIEPLVSMADGRPITIVAQREKERILTAAVDLLALHPALFTPGFGAALVKVPASGSLEWPLLLDSEAARQKSRNFLAEFSNVDCLRLRLRDQAGYCSGRLRGHDARIRVERLSTGAGATGGNRFDQFLIGGGDLVLVTYVYRDLPNSQIEAATLAGLRLLLVVAILIPLGCWVILWLNWLRTRNESGEPSPRSLGAFFHALVMRLDAPRTGEDVQAGEVGKLELEGGYAKIGILGLASGFIVFTLCWWMENRIYFTIAAHQREAACELLRADAAPGKEGPKDTPEIRRLLGCENFSQPTSHLAMPYYLIRPSEGRLLESAARLSERQIGGVQDSRFGADFLFSRTGLRRSWPLLLGLAFTLFLIRRFLGSRPIPDWVSAPPAQEWWHWSFLVVAALLLLVSIVYLEALAVWVFAALSSLGALRTSLPEGIHLFRADNGERKK